MGNTHSSRSSTATRAGKHPGPFQDMGESLLRAPKLVLSDAERRRLDESPDADFYSTPRMMQHADDDALSALSSIYRSLLPAAACVLELCASRHSHLPPELQPRLMVGQGMNSAECATNPALHQHFVQDLNLQPLLLEQLDASYDVVLCANGIQYLTQPETVVAEASRVLRPGGMLVVSFSPHCFREKAVAGWLSRSMAERTQLLQQILEANGFETPFAFDSPQAAAAAALNGAGQQPLPPQSSSPTSTPPFAAAAGAAAADSNQEQQLLQVLLAFKSADKTAGAAEADTAAGGVADMRPENVERWFTKPGLAGLAEAAGGAPAATSSSSSSGPKPPPPPPPQQALNPPPPSLAPASAVNERLLEQWHAAYSALANDAVDLGIPRSVIPAVSADASPAELQEAVQHLQAMMASFLSSGL